MNHKMRVEINLSDMNIMDMLHLQREIIDEIAERMKDKNLKTKKKKENRIPQKNKEESSDTDDSMIVTPMKDNPSKSLISSKNRWTKEQEKVLCDKLKNAVNYAERTKLEELIGKKWPAIYFHATRILSLKPPRLKKVKYRIKYSMQRGAKNDPNYRKKLEDDNTQMMRWHDKDSKETKIVPKIIEDIERDVEEANK